MSLNLRPAFQWALAGIVAAAISGAAQAQLQITEIMFNPNDPVGGGSDLIYEWIEVRNTGVSSVFLDGVYADDTLPNSIPTGGQPSILSGQSQNTVIPAGGVAILYDALLANPTSAEPNFDDSKFRASWGLSESVPLIGMNFWPTLNNTSGVTTTDGMGLWIDQPTYEMDVDRNGTPTDTTDDTVTYDNTFFNFSYKTVAPWPTPVAGHSIYWDGNGSVTDGAQWHVSQPDDDTGAVTNAQINYMGTTPVDRGSPGEVPAGPKPSAVRISEVMYNPANLDEDWEWVEIYNGTASSLNLAGAVFDDDDGGALAASNIAAGSIAAGGIGVLYDAALSLSQIQAVWGTGINFIPVGNWTALIGNSGDEIGLWANLASYQSETQSPRTFNNALATVDFLNNAGSPLWPDDDNAGSIYMTDLTLTPNQGSSWLLSSSGGDEGTGFNSAGGDAVEKIAHPGGDVGSPGSFAVIVDEGLDGDFNDDGVVDALDYTVWRNNFGDANETDINNNGNGGDVGEGDFDLWKLNYGEGDPGGGGLAAVPEPTSLMIVLLGLAGIGCLRRR